MAISYHKKIVDARVIDDYLSARVILAGGVATVTASSLGGRAPVTVRLPGGAYLRRDTGEIIEPTVSLDGVKRAASLAASMEQLRHIIQAGVRPGSAWLTLTYRANVRDTGAVYEDFEAFIRAVRRRVGRRLEYIAAIEPQARGAWHVHGILVPGKDDFDPVYVPQVELLAIWRGIAGRRMPAGDDRTAGGVHIHRIADGGDFIGAYLTAYLSDVTGKKGGRLHLYPKGCHFYRTSRGIDRPVVYDGLSLAEARKMAAEYTGNDMSYSKGYVVVDDQGNSVACGIREQSVKGRRGR